MTIRNRGFGLVEIMVGLVIGMLCIAVIMQVAFVFEQQKRDTTTGGDAQTNGALALYLMEREIRAAGSGMTEGEPQKFPPLAGCTTRIFDTANPGYLVPTVKAADPSTKADPGTASNVRLAPVIATDGIGGLSDSLTLTYGTALITAPYTLSAAYNPATGPAISLTSTAGIRANDMVALVETNVATGVVGNYLTPTTCSLLQATAVAPAALTATPGRYNQGAGALGYGINARLYNLGQLNLVTYRIGGNDLIADIAKFGSIPDGGAGTAVANRTDSSPIVSNIVNMQVQYGIDASNPGGAALANCKAQTPGIPLTTDESDAVVDAWVDPTDRWENNGANTPTLFDLRRIRAVRIGLVARSGVRNMIDANGNKTDVGALCATTTTAPVISWDAGPSMNPNLAGDPDWQCYRYKVFQVTIPVRNALWSGTMNPASPATCGARSPA